MRKPNFFIVGAARCGTTALYEYLCDHPNVFMSRVKEPGFWAEDFPGMHRVGSLDKYMELFQAATRKHLAVGEASTIYLYSSVAISNLLRFNPDARIIVMLRNPVEMIYSFHSVQLQSFNENVTDFEQAWRLQPLRKKGLHIPPACRDPKLLHYAQVGRLGEQVERLTSIFPPKKVHFVLFDDFRSSTKTVYEDVLRFLHIPSDGRRHFPPVNPSPGYRIRWLGSFSARPPYFLRHVAESIKKLLRNDSIHVGSVFRKLNRREKSRPPLSPAFRKELVEEFREDVAKLSRILGRQLTHWVT